MLHNNLLGSLYSQGPHYLQYHSPWRNLSSALFKQWRLSYIWSVQLPQWWNRLEWTRRRPSNVWLELRILRAQIESNAKLLDICISSAEKFVPWRKTTDKKVSRIPRSRRILMRRHSKVNKQLTSTSSEAKKARLMEEYRNIEKKLQDSYLCQKSDMEHKAIQSIQRNSKYFFSYARKFSKISSGIGPFIDTAKNIVTCPSKMASMLAEQYSSVFSSPKEPLSDPHVMFPDVSTKAAAGFHLDDTTFNTEDIEKAISEISASAAAGPDHSPALLLKQCKHVLSQPLYLMWRPSLDTGEAQSLSTRRCGHAPLSCSFSYL